MSQIMKNNETPEPSSGDDHVEIVPADALERIERAQIDTQIATAKQYPRKMSLVKKEMLELATLDQETAATCFYTLRRKNADGTMKVIEGPSARLAEIAANAFGNMYAVSRIIGNDGKMITAQAVCHDLQKNVRIGVEVKRRITGRNGQTFSEDMQVVTGNAACSIALRNAVFKVIPMALVKPIYDAAKKTAVGDSKTLADRRASAVAAFDKLGVSKERIFHTLQINGVEEIGLSQLEVLIGMHTAIKDGDSTIDEMFTNLDGNVKTPLFKASATSTDQTTEKPNPLIEIRKLITESKLDEGVVLQHLRNVGMVDESLTTLDEVFAMAPSALDTAVKAWRKNILPKLVPGAAKS
jgi:hypothetical protein